MDHAPAPRASPAEREGEAVRVGRHGRDARPRPGDAPRVEAGVSAVELVIVLPILLSLVLGMFSGGIAYDHKLSLTHAAREAGRFGATLPFDPGDPGAWLTAVADRAEEAAVGKVSSGEPGRYICVAYAHPDEGIAERLERTDSGDSFSSGDCPDVDDDDLPDDQARAQVRLERNSDFNAFFFSTTITVSSTAVARHEVTE